MYNAIQNLKSWASVSTSKETEKVNVGSGHDKPDHEDDEEDEGGLLDLLSLLSVGGMFGFLLWTIQGRWRANRAAKGSKGY